MEGPAAEGEPQTYGMNPGSFDQQSALGFRFRPGTFKRRWAKPTQAEIYFTAGKYGSYTVAIEAIDWDDRIITVANAGRQFDRYPICKSPSSRTIAS